MNILRTSTAGTLLAIVAGSALSATAYASETEAMARLEAARAAFEAARAELIAAESEVAGYTEVEATDTSVPAVSTTQPADDAPPPDPESWKDGWDFTVNIGFNGATGNNENFSARAALDGERKTSKYETAAGLSYIYSTSSGTKNSSRGVAHIHNDWLTDSKWRYFAQGKWEYDEFQAWEHRLSAAGGVGYEFINDDKQTLIGRAGLGVSYETGGTATEDLVPEGLLGLDWTYRVSDNSTLKASTTYFPNLDDFGEFRWVNTAGLEVVMDADSGMTLNTGFEHRHDSDPGTGVKSNDLDYYMGLGWKF